MLATAACAHPNSPSLCCTLPGHWVHAPLVPLSWGWRCQETPGPPIPAGGCAPAVGFPSSYPQPAAGRAKLIPPSLCLKGWEGIYRVSASLEKGELAAVLQGGAQEGPHSCSLAGRGSQGQLGVSSTSIQTILLPCTAGFLEAGEMSMATRNPSRERFPPAQGFCSQQQPAALCRGRITHG